jgi:hypothetical protein
MSIWGNERDRLRSRQGWPGANSWLAVASTFFALALTAALISVVVRAPAKVAATVLAARAHGGW